MHYPVCDIDWKLLSQRPQMDKDLFERIAIDMLRPNEDAVAMGDDIIDLRVWTGAS